MSAKPRYHGRKEPYTVIGIRRKPCVRCGQPSVYQWQICANNRHYVTVCGDCDIDLNRMVLEWAKFPNAAELLAHYKENLP